MRPNPRLFVTFRNEHFFEARVCKPHAQPPSWKTTHCWLSSSAYSIYSQLPFISGGRLVLPQPEDAPCRGDKLLPPSPGVSLEACRLRHNLAASSLTASRPLFRRRYLYIYFTTFCSVCLLCVRRIKVIKGDSNVCYFGG
jgi:hypothetical protein